jgi:S1-C subfamily serine protease
VADHALEREDDLHISMPDGRKLGAAFAGRAPAADLAAVRVSDLGVEPARVSKRVARVGNVVVAIGRTWRGALSATAGIVGGIGAPVRTGHGPAVDEVIRVDVGLRPGFSGGPLVDATGDVVGIMTAGLMRGAPLAIPAVVAWRIGDELSAHGRIRRGHLGVSTQPVRIPPAQRAGRDQEVGLLVVGVGADSPAARAGVHVGDIMVGFGGRRVDDPEELIGLLTADRIGATVPVEVVRGAGLTVIDLTVGEHGA